MNEVCSRKWDPSYADPTPAAGSWSLVHGSIRRRPTISGHSDWAAHTAVVIHCSSFCLGAAPIWRDAIFPSLKIISVGIDWIPYLAAVWGFSSTLSFTILTLPLSVPAISSSAGAIMRHGPHHSAQKSTTTGSVAFNTSASTVASETLPTAMARTSFAQRCRRGWETEPRMGAEPRNALGKRQGGFKPT